MPELPKLKPIPIKHRFSVLFLEKGHLNVEDGSFLWIDHEGVRVHVPVGSVTCLLLEPGTRISHAAVSLAARTGTLLIWVGEAAVRVYSAGQPGGARSDRLLYQAKLALDDKLRLKVVREMFRVRFNEDAPSRRSVDQLRGLEGARVRERYKLIAQQYGLVWKGRKYDPKKWADGDLMNRSLSVATSCLYGVTEAAVLASGYAPAIGFLHTGKPRSFVYDIADLIKFETVVPVAFRCVAAIKKNAIDDIETSERLVRYGCRDMFRSDKTLSKLIPLIEDVLAAGGIDPPSPAKDQVLPAIPNEEVTGDDGHRH